MRFIYSFSIKLYRLIIGIAAILNNKKAQNWKNGRINWISKVKKINPDNRKLIWFHAASLGEFEQARPLIDKIKKDKPSIFILLTFFSPSGYEVRKNYNQADEVIYLPLDTKKNAKHFVELIQPSLVIFVKYEFWFNYLKALENSKIPTFLISGIFRNSQHFFKFYGFWFRKNLTAFTHFYLQNIESKVLLDSIGFTNTTISGDTRFDRVCEVAKNEFSDQKLELLDESELTIIFGSSWPKEDEFAIQLSKDFKQLNIIVAPHEIKTEKVKELKFKFGKHCQLYSEINNQQGLKYIILDNVGMLSKIYRFANLAFIGGGFGSGIHNLPEAAVYGCPVIFGPNFSKFKEASDLIAVGGGYSVLNYDELKHHVQSFINHTERLKSASNAAKDYIQKNSGASDKIFKDLKTVI
jgi:3-deoxy-D-manno-octulosonic-acid transferase